VNHETVVLKGLQDLPHVYHMLLVVPAADDDVVHPGKCCLTVLNGPVHVLVLVIEQAEGAGDGGLLHILRVD
jgi:hypothetical protein